MGIGPKADPAPENRGRAPCLKKFKGLFFEKKTRILNVINVNNKQYLQGVFYSLLSLQKHRECVKGHQTISRPQKLYRAGTAPPC